MNAFSHIPDFAEPLPAGRLPDGPRIPASHLVVIYDAETGTFDLPDQRMGRSFQALASDLAAGHDLPWGVLHAVLHLEAGACSDVTTSVLHEIAAICEANEWELPSRLAPAFEQYGVPGPQAPDEEWSDPNAEHRLTAQDYGLGRAA